MPRTKITLREELELEIGGWWAVWGGGQQLPIEGVRSLAERLEQIAEAHEKAKARARKWAERKVDGRSGS